MSGSQYVWIFNGVSLMLSFGVLTGRLLENVAFNKPAAHISTSGPGSADKAVDGNRDPNFYRKSCSLTVGGPDPWWRVDLQDVYRIGAIMITNRDALEYRLDGAEIWIGTSIEIFHKDSVRCAIISRIPKGRTFYFPCSAAEGRYVTLRIPGSPKYLCLCEVEVYPEDTRAYHFENVAPKGFATQSSTYYFADASKAIDGKRNSFYDSGSCSNTAINKTDPWWRVDLKRTYLVGSVKITNRGDCCAEKLDGAEIRIGDSMENDGNSNRRCASISHIGKGKTYVFHCDGGSMAGRFVNVRIPGEGKTLTLCEVEVYTVPAVEEPLQNMALGKPTAVSSTQAGGPHRPVPVCASISSDDRCCSPTSPSEDPWWRVDLEDFYMITAITITNRGDCCQERFLGAEIWIGTKPDFRNFGCGYVSPIRDTVIYTLLCGGGEGRYIFVSVPEQIVATCGVEVYASKAGPVLPTLPPVLVLPTPPAPTPPPPTPPPPPTASMPLGGRSVTMVGHRLCWSDALLYCRRHHWDLLSLDSQEEQREMEELLRRSPFPLTGFVWLGLRRYMRSDEWFWMSGASMKFTKWPQDSPPNILSSLCGGLATAEHHLWGDQPCQEPLHFICQSRDEDGEEERVYFYSTREGRSDDG